ncbi:unnamed protein product [Microthlaspi erraticum]|uniref:Uncharacterized protein n=1 Tax=Microthlaspi erraticum TaxID=1685480 RepID=A0A6D2KLV2_9BRAS|nr:unnamed protein product [Microthlaspi erraticum]
MSIGLGMLFVVENGPTKLTKDLAATTTGSSKRGQDSVQVLARALAVARPFPEMESTVYAPAVQVKRKLKNGSLSVKPKPGFPWLHFHRICIEQRDPSEIVRESEVSYHRFKSWKHVSIRTLSLSLSLKQAKEEQEKAGREFDELQRAEEEEEASLASQKLLLASDSENVASLAATETKEKLAAGSTVRLLSLTFAEFVGNLKKLNRKTAKATVGFTLFGS